MIISEKERENAKNGKVKSYFKTLITEKHRNYRVFLLSERCNINLLLSFIGKNKHNCDEVTA